MKRKGISRLEMFARELVEDSFGRLLGGYLEPMDVANRLVEAMEDSVSDGEHALEYDVTLHPTDYRALISKNPDLADELATAAWAIGRRYGLPIVSRPTLFIGESDKSWRHSVKIRPRSTASDLETTQVVSKARHNNAAMKSLLALDAFLVVRGRRHVSLDKPVITIGRRPDNDIVIDSASVSRQHAQIRWRFDRFILYDVSNRGRTLVNGEPVIEHILQPGDVITLSNILLVYAEGRERSENEQDKWSTDETTTLIRPANRLKPSNHGRPTNHT